MSSELRPVVKYARAHRTEFGDVTAHVGRVGDTEVVITQLGVGPAVARATTERVLGSVQADHVLVCGVAGGLRADLRVGAVVVPDEVVEFSTGRRFQPSPMDGVELSGLVATTDVIITDEQRVAEMEEMGVVAVEMESSGVAEACQAAGVPWTTFRVISDRPDEDLIDDAITSLLRPDGSSDAMAAVRLMARHPGRVPSMVKLGRDSSMAAAKAARIALRALGWTP